MSGGAPLHAWLLESARRGPDRPALHEPGEGELSYRELDTLSARVRDRLAHVGVRPQDRVGIYLHKSIDSVAAIFGALRAGAGYVPIDPGSPPWRAAYILNDCSVRALIVERRLLDALLAVATLPAECAVIAVEVVGGGRGLAAALPTVPAPEVRDATPAPEDLAYILYTSGSTGKPKGVTLSHRAARSFVDWCSEAFLPRAEDRFSSHAPLHFDLSIFDLYVPFKHGARLTLLGEELGKDPAPLAGVIAAERLTVWYSTPSTLGMLAQYGRLERHDLSALRLVLFAGEVFPVPALRALTAALPAPRYFNLYGPTETNVCTYFELPRAIEPSRATPFPIGRTCSHLRSMVVDPAGRPVARGEEGELVISGPAVMSGYWNLPERNAEAFLVDPAGTRWYRTGDLVVEGPDGVHEFHGRRDRMVKRRGYRIELGEIEAGLARHPGVREVAVVGLPDQGAGVRIKAWVGSTGGDRLSIIDLKRFCAEHLPGYMVPDVFAFVATLPRTSTNKIDYQALSALA